MEYDNGILHLGPFFAVTLGIIVLFVGKRLNDVMGVLREFSIPEPVTGGLMFSVLFTLVYITSHIEVEFDLAARDVLLVYSLPPLASTPVSVTCSAGGKPLVILLAITISYMFLQNLTGISVAALFDLPSASACLAAASP